MQVGCWGQEVDRRGKSAKVTLFVLYGFLDAEKHRGEPLVQPWDGIKFLHLGNESEILPKLPQRFKKRMLCYEFICREMSNLGRSLHTINTLNLTLTPQQFKLFCWCNVSVLQSKLHYVLIIVLKLHLTNKRALLCYCMFLWGTTAYRPRETLQHWHLCRIFKLAATETFATSW